MLCLKTQFNILYKTNDGKQLLKNPKQHDVIGNAVQSRHQTDCKGNNLWNTCIKLST